MSRGILVCELRNRRSTSKSMILARFWILSGYDGKAGKLGRAPISLCTIQSDLNTIQKGALIERLGQVADDPSLKCAGTNIIARIGSYQYGWNLFARSRQVLVQIEATHLGHVEIDNQASGAAQFG